jgi:hypothetical protein
MSETYSTRCGNDKRILNFSSKTTNRLLVILCEGIERNNIKMGCRKPLDIRTCNTELTVFNNFTMVIKLHCRFSFGFFRFQKKTAHILSRYLSQIFLVITSLASSLKEITADFFNIIFKSP